MPLVAQPQPNPEIIAWAIRESGRPADAVARRLSVASSRLDQWTSGDRPPTVRQLMELATYLHRPLSLFYSQAPPRQAPLAAQYRRLPGVTAGAESPELRLAIRQMLARRDAAIDLQEELGYDLPDFALTAHPSEAPRSVGERLRAATGIGPTDPFAWRDVWQAWRTWRSKLEDLGLLVFMFPSVAMTEARGLTLPDHPLPVVAVNTREMAESRSYSALHETVHVMLANAGEEEPALRDRHSAQDWEAIERFADAAASYALIDERTLSASTSATGVPHDLEGMRSLARRFKVSPLAMATRLRASTYLTRREYEVWRNEWDSWVATLPARRPGIATPVSKTLGRGGTAFAQLVLEALDTRRITTSEAARHLSLRPDRFDELRARVLAGASAGAPDE